MRECGFFEWVKDTLRINRYCIVCTRRDTREVIRFGNHSKYLAKEIVRAMNQDNYFWIRKIERLREET